MKIKTEKEFIACRQAMEAIIQKGTAIGDIELLCEEDKKKYIETRVFNLMYPTSESRC